MPIQKADYSTINFDDMAASIGLKPKHIPRLIESFVNETSSIMDVLLDSIQKKDFEKIKQTAHSIKGSAGNLKFNEIYEMSKEMELAAMESDGDFEYKLYFDSIKSIIKTIPN